MLRRDSIPVGLLVLLAFVARLLPGPRTIDDAYITFRYARNILAGNGFVYNTGERVLGTTTPLYTLLMAAEAGLLGMRDANGQAAGFPELALITNAIAGGASVWILYRLGKRLGNGPLVGLALAAVWAIHPRSVTFAIGGMETSAFVALMLGTFASSIERRPRATAALAALALLTRPEALIAISLLAGNVLLDAIRSKGQSLRTARFDAILIFVALVLPWFVFATYYFGSPVPGSIAAKGVAYQLPAEQALVNFLQAGVVMFSGEGSFHPIAAMLLIAVYIALFALGALSAIRKERRAGPLFGFAILYLAAYVIANPLIFRWYIVPPLPILILGIALGWDTITHTLRSAAATRWAFGAGAAIAIWSSIGGWWIPDHGPTLPAPRMAYIKLELTYLQAADRLRGDANAETLIAAGDIGAIGYATGARIYDTLGLITPDARRYYPVPPGALVPPLPYAIPAQLILDAQPDFIVIVEAYGRNTFLQDSGFQAQYERVEKIESDATRDYQSEGMLIFRRVRN